MTQEHSRNQTPPPKVEGVTEAEKKKLEKKVDEELEEFFPASDPPAFNAGDAVGAPKPTTGK